MALFGFNSRRYEMLMSVCFTCLCNSTFRKFRCVDNFNRYINYICLRPYLQRYTAELQDRAPLQAQSAIQFSLDRGFSYKKLSQLALDLVASPASQAYFERLLFLCGDLTARELNSTKVSLCRRVILKLNRHILALNSMYCELSVTSFWYCRTAEDTLQRLRF